MTQVIYLKADFYLSREQIFMVRGVEWATTPARGDLVSLGRGRSLAPVKDVYEWEGGLNVYLDVPNERALALVLKEDGWRAQDPDPMLAT